MRLARFTTALAAAVVLVPVTGTAPAAAVEVACGMEVTGDLVLSADLVCPGDALLVAAEEVTIDLGGHTIRHAGERGDRGVATVGSVDARVRLVNGTVSNFAVGVDYDFMQLTLQGMTFSGNGVGTTGYLGSLAASQSRWEDNDRGITGNYQSGLTLTDVVLQDNRVGFSIDKGTDITVTRARVVGNQTGIFGFGAQMTVVDSVVARNDVGVYGGVGADPEGERLRLLGTRVTGNRIGVDASAAVQVTGGVFARNGTGVRHFGDPFLPTRLTVSRAVFDRNGVGLQPVGDSSLVLSRSSLSRNGAGVVAVDTQGSLTVKHNAFTGNRGAGFFADRITVTGTESVVAANAFFGNGFRPDAAPVDTSNDGLFVRVADGPLTVASNLAVGNAGQGIEAHGVVDGGGNRASGNLASPQCIGVVCS